MAEEDPDAVSKKSALTKEMTDRLAATDAHFKHQQRGEPDLTQTEKAQIAMEILQRNPAKFLEQFSKFLTIEDTECFKDLRGDYMIDFYISDIVQRHKDTNKNVIKNRRYQAMQSLMREGDYFSEEEMRRRDPLLFEHLVGQYETEEEQAEKAERSIDRSDLRFSNILLKHMDIQADQQLLNAMKEREEEQEEEEEESDEEEDIEEDDEEEDDKKSQLNNQQNKGKAGDQPVGDTISEMERSLLKNEFLKIMQERFLSGEDTDFDYKSVDANTDFDSLDILSHDAEEKYFDSEVPHTHGRHLPGSGQSDSPLSECGGAELPHNHLRRRLRALELQEKSRAEKRGDSEEDMDSEDYMKFDVTVRDTCEQDVR